MYVTLVHVASYRMGLSQSGKPINFNLSKFKMLSYVQFNEEEWVILVSSWFN